MFGLLVWISLLTRAALLASEVNVVRVKQLWPRSVLGSQPTDTDRRAIEDAVQREALLRDARVQVVLGGETPRPQPYWARGGRRCLELRVRSKNTASVGIPRLGSGMI